MRVTGYVIAGLIAGLVIGAAVVYYLPPYRGGDEVGTEGQSMELEKEKKILYWRAPMDPTYISDKPGKSPMGMDLIPVYEGEEESVEPGTVKIDPVTVQNIGVRAVPVERRVLKRTIRTVGRVGYDEKRVYHIHTKVDGWIEKLYIDFTGQEVKKDDILLEFYSPKLVSAQEEYLMAERYAGRIKEVGRESLLELARRRLELWDVPAHQIKELEETGKVMKTLHIHSPADGIVVEKPVTEGMYANPGTKLYTIADISKVWVYADVYEYETPWIKEGQAAEVTLAAYPGEVFYGKVSFIYPFMEPKTRTNKVRLEFPNPGRRLKPDMYVNVRLSSVVGRNAVAVPKEAVLLSGERSIVILSRGGGKFTPRVVTLGAETEDYYQVRKGLSEGDMVVTSAQFLIDSEARLKEAITKMLEGKGAESAPMDHEGVHRPDTGSMDQSEMITDHPGMDGMGQSGMKDSEHSGKEGTKMAPAGQGHMDHNHKNGSGHPEMGSSGEGGSMELREGHGH